MDRETTNKPRPIILINSTPLIIPPPRHPTRSPSTRLPIKIRYPPRHPPPSSSLRPPKEWQLSKDRFAQQDAETLAWCILHNIDPIALASGHQKRPPLPSFAD